MSVASRLAAWWSLTGGLPAQTRATGEQPTGDLTVELFVGGSWVDLTAAGLVYERDKVVITRGQAGEGSELDRSTCRLTLNNRGGLFSPRNPEGAYYGQIGRNTPLRVSVQAGLAKSYRFWGEVTAWPPKWDSSGSDVWVEIEARGILRRLTQGDSPLKSVMYRAWITLATLTPIAYWPCEDADGSTVFGSAVSGGAAMTWTGTPTLASSTGFAASDALPLVSSSTWTGRVQSYTADNFTQVRFVMIIPSTGITNNAVICSIRTSGTLKRTDITYTTASGGGLSFSGYDVDSNLLVTAGPVTGVDGAGLDGKAVSVTMSLAQDGADLSAILYVTEAGDSTSDSDFDAATATVGQITTITIDPDATVGDTAIGHIVAHTSPSFVDEKYDELAAYAGETAGRRIERLCSEERIDFQSIGDLDDTAAMGTQGIATLVDLIKEAAAADGGILYELTSALGFGYRARTSLYNQAAGLALDYSAGHLFGELTPVDDDLLTRNDITVSRTGGSSARRELTAGALSTARPPHGVGRYDEGVTLNLETDEQLPDQAGWRLHLGTVDEARYPQVTLHLMRQVVLDSATLRIDTLGLRPGDRLTIGSLPAWLPPDDASLLVVGWSESIDKFEHTVTFNCVPESPWRVATVDGGTSVRVGTDGSELAAGVDSSATSLSVSVTAGELWTTDAGEAPFDVRVGGEVMTVTAVSGASSPQTFTVTRSTNGVSKAHQAGAAVSSVALAQPAIVAL